MVLQQMIEEIRAALRQRARRADHSLRGRSSQSPAACSASISAEIERLQQRLGGMHAAEPPLNLAIDDAVIDGRGFPAHARRSCRWSSSAALLYQRAKRGETRFGFAVDDAVDPFRTEVALKSRDDHGKRNIHIRRDAIAELCKFPGERSSPRRAVGGLHPAMARGVGKNSDSGLRQLPPREQFAGIVLARRRHVGVTNHAVRRNGMPCRECRAPERSAPRSARRRTGYSRIHARD